MREGPWWFCRVPKLSKGSRLQSPTFSKKRFCLSMFASWCLCFSHFADFSALFWTPSHQPGTHFTKTPGTHPSAASGRSVVGDVGRPTWICHFLEGNFFEAKLHQLEEVTSDKSLRWDIKFWMTVELYQSQVSLKLVLFFINSIAWFKIQCTFADIAPKTKQHTNTTKRQNTPKNNKSYAVIMETGRGWMKKTMK